MLNGSKEFRLKKIRMAMILELIQSSSCQMVKFLWEGGVGLRLMVQDSGQEL